MIKNIALAVLVVILAIVLTMGTQHYLKSEKGDFFVLEQGKTVPNFTFETIEGHRHSLSDFQNRSVIIHFWATWCAPCVVELPELIAFAQHNPDAVVLTFTSDRMPPSITRFFEQRKLIYPDNFKVIWDEKGAITRQKFSVFQLPESFILDKHHHLTDHIIGAYTGWNESSLF